MVSPLTNFTGLSLYFQLYLVEIFHVKFYTKLGHYLCMVGNFSLREQFLTDESACIDASSSTQILGFLYCASSLA